MRTFSVAFVTAAALVVSGSFVMTIGAPRAAAVPVDDVSFTSLNPARLLDTRSGAQTIDGAFAGGGALGQTGSVDLTVVGRGGVPASGVGAVVLNVTATDPTGTGFIAVYPTGTQRPNASNLNFIAAQTTPNLVITKVGANGQVTLFNSAGNTHLIADVVGWFPAASSTPGPTRVATAITAGRDHSCALFNDTTISCWGNNNFGLLGDPDYQLSDSNVPIGVRGINATAVSGGDQFSCALLTDTTIKCWGYNGNGQLGNGGSPTFYSRTPVTVIGISGAIAISAGAYHSCALLVDSTVKCWGDNSFGQLGNGTHSNSNTPVAVVGISDATAISVGLFYSCALLADTTIRCWGSDANGTLGDGFGAFGESFSNVPVRVVGVIGATQVATGDSHACALLADKTIACWGRNNEGQLGNGRIGGGSIFLNYEAAPVAVLAVVGGTAVSAGGNNTCALTADSTMKCWGANLDGQVGNGTNTLAEASPLAVAGITGATKMDTGSAHSCVVLAGNSVDCWGTNLYGQLGNGDFTFSNSNVPVTVIGR